MTDTLVPCTIEAVDLSKSYGDEVVLEGVSFTAHAGDTIAFVSPSGSGKSTLLSMLGLLLTPTTGDVIVNGISTNGLDDERKSHLRRETFGFVFQHTQLIGSLRAWENVAVPARFVSDRSFDDKARAFDLLEQFGLSDRAHHYPFQLSIGQKRRIATARALLLSPQILIADEPTNDLDVTSATSVTKALFDHAEKGGILLYATHDLELAQRAKTVMHLEDKRFITA